MIATVKQAVAETVATFEALGQVLDEKKNLPDLPAARALVELDKLQARARKLAAQLQAAGVNGRGKGGKS
jgi:hypothetical protein